MIIGKRYRSCLRFCLYRGPGNLVHRFEVRPYDGFCARVEGLVTVHEIELGRERFRVVDAGVERRHVDEIGVWVDGIRQIPDRVDALRRVCVVSVELGFVHVSHRVLEQPDDLVRPRPEIVEYRPVDRHAGLVGASLDSRFRIKR